MQHLKSARRLAIAQLSKPHSSDVSPLLKALHLRALHRLPAPSDSTEYYIIKYCIKCYQDVEKTAQTCVRTKGMY